MFPLAAMLNSSLFAAATLADDAVVEVIHVVKDLEPTVEAWETCVNKAALHDDR